MIQFNLTFEFQEWLGNIFLINKLLCTYEHLRMKKHFFVLCRLKWNEFVQVIFFLLMCWSHLPTRIIIAILLHIATMKDDHWNYKIYLLGCENVPDRSRYLWNLLASLPLLFYCVLPCQRDCEIQVHRGDLSFILLAGNGKYDGQSCHLLLDEHKV